MLGWPGGTRQGGRTRIIAASLLVAATLTACFEGPSVSTTGADDEQAQAEGDAWTEGTGENAGSETRRDASTDSGQLVDQSRTREDPKPSAATTEPADTADDEEDEDEGEAPEDDPEEDSPDDEADDPDEGDSDGDGSEDDEPSGPPADDGSDAGLAATSVAYVNDRRNEAGLGTLAGDPELTAMADRWARQMLAEQDLHHNPNLGSEKPAGYGTVGENIAYSSTPTNIDDMWWDSDGHRANILGSSYTHIGVAFVEDDRGTTWAVQVFAG